MMKNIICGLLLLSLSACGTAQKVQYSALEKVGVHKRDILVDRIEKTSEVQTQTKQEFQSAYENLTSLVGVADRDLENNYSRLEKAVEAGEDRTKELRERIDSVDEVATALFAEWQEELALYDSANLRSVSENNLRTTQQRYAAIYSQMQASYDKVIPVLEVLQDNTLYLKHNLNASAISGISSEVLSVESKVAELINQMEASINESKQFIDAMES